MISLKAWDTAFNLIRPWWSESAGACLRKTIFTPLWAFVRGLWQVKAQNFALPRWRYDRFDRWRRRRRMRSWMRTEDENGARGRGTHVWRSRILCTSRVGECSCSSVSFSDVTSNHVLHGLWWLQQIVVVIAMARRTYSARWLRSDVAAKDWIASSGLMVHWLGFSGDLFVGRFDFLLP